MAAKDNYLSRIIQQAFAPQVQFGEVIYPARAVFGPRIQQQFQLVILVRGEARIEVDEEIVIASAGDVVLLKPGHREFFHFSTSSETDHSWCALDPVLVPRNLLRSIKLAPRRLAVSETMDQLIALGLRSGAGENDSAFLAQLALSALCSFVREARAATQQPALPEPLRRSRDLIEKHYAEPLTVAEIGRRSGLSANHLIKLFRRYLGETPAEYLWRIRIDHGVRLLRETGLTISEIAFRSGFQNPFHFSRLVKKRYHRPPRELRREWWKKGS